MLELIPAGTSQSQDRHITTDNHSVTFTPTGNLESPINLHVFGLWEEARVPGENPRRHEENMQTPQRRVPVGQWDTERHNIVKYF